MDSIALQLGVRYATKSRIISLAQKIIDGLIEQKKNKKKFNVQHDLLHLFRHHRVVNLHQ